MTVRRLLLLSGDYKSQGGFEDRKRASSVAYKTIEDTHIFAIILKKPIFQWPICKSKDGNLYQNYRPNMVAGGGLEPPTFGL